jgi:cell division protein FtsW (lipid II flippase)
VSARAAAAEQNEHVTWEQLVGAPLVPPARVRAAQSRLAVRSWPEAAQQFATLCGGVAGFLVVAHLLLRWRRPGADPFLLPLVGLLSGLGILMLFSLKDPVRDMPTYAAQAWALVIGGGAALLLAQTIVGTRVPLHRYGYLYAVAAVALTIVLGIFGSGPGGVKLSVAGTQPVEIIKILMVFFLAAYLAERGPLLNDPLRRLGPLPLPRRRDALPLLFLYALPLALFGLVKDLGPVLLLFGALVLLVYLATGRGVYVALGLLAVIAGGVFGYRLGLGVFDTRVDMFLSPWRNDHPTGDHLALGLWGLASGGPWGSGLGLGAPRFIPRGGSDLAFASLGEELGLVGTLLVVVCFFAIVARGLRIARRAGSDFDRLLAAGLSGLLAIQALVILSGTLGLFPLTGVTLPFISYGKSSLVASFFAVGVLLALSAKQRDGAGTPLTGGGWPDRRACMKLLLPA